MNWQTSESNTTANIGLAIWRLKYFYETFVLFKPPLRQAAETLEIFFKSIKLTIL